MCEIVGKRCSPGEETPETQAGVPATTVGGNTGKGGEQGPAAHHRGGRAGPLPSKKGGRESLQNPGPLPV